MTYKHGDWYVKPANEAEAREIVERAVASGAYNKYLFAGGGMEYWCYGVRHGLVFYGSEDEWVDATQHTIAKVRELFPLPCDHKQAKQKYPIGSTVEVRMNGAWHPATVYGQASDYIIARADGYWYDEYTDEYVRPLRSDRDRWVAEAEVAARTVGATNVIGAVYDALKSGTIKAPEVER